MDRASPPDTGRSTPTPTPTPAETNPKSCFICLQTSAETPNEPWVTPCPCTLDVHEACMLRWISETEASGGGRSKLRCPACNSRIQVLEPWDPVVALGDSYHRLYSRASPFFLVSIFMTMGIAGSGYYGFQSMLLFAGAPKTLSWLGLRKTVASAARVPLLSWRHGMALICKLFLLNLIAPCLLLQRALPSLGNLIALPASFLYGSALISRKKLPTWPPSPEWALAMMPYVSFAYSSAYYDLFGSLERRLNQALRGRPARNEVPAAAPGVVANGDHEAMGEMAPRGEGVLAAVRRVGQAMARLLHNDDIAIENVGAAAEFGNGQDIEFQLEIVVGHGGEEAENEDAPPADGPQEPVNDDAAQPPPDIQRGRQPPVEAGPAGNGDENNDNNVNNNNGNNGNDGNNNNNNMNVNGNRNNEVVGDANRAVALFADILSALTTQLLLPRISAAAGQLLETVLPRSWVTRPPYRKPAGLLQEQWGRSLVGGCLFIVLRDALNLYGKYRRVQVKRLRKIKNVNRQRR